MLSLGIDIGGTTVKLALLDAGRAVAVRQSADGYASPTPEMLAAEIRSVAGGLPTPQRVGVCLPGLFDPVSRSLTASINLPRLVGANLDGILAGAGKDWPRAHVVPDAMAAAIDYQQAHQIRSRLLAVSLGTGVGACVLDDGVPLRVSPPETGFSSGHLGQIDVSESEGAPRSPDGSRGTVEAYLGSEAIRTRLKVREGSSLPPLDAEDPAVRALVRVLRISHAIYRPDVVALLGGVSFAITHLSASLHDRVSDGLTSLARPGWRLAFADDTLHAARGAARLAERVSGES